MHHNSRNSIKPFSQAHLDLLSQEAWTSEEWLFWTGHRFSFPMVKEEFYRHFQEEGRSWWVMKKGEELIGVGELQIMDQHQIKLSRIYIFKAFRGKNYAKSLIHLLMEKGRKILENPVFSLNVFEENEIAVNLYNDLGFREVEDNRKPMEIGDKEYVLMNMVLKK